MITRRIVLLLLFLIILGVVIGVYTSPSATQRVPNLTLTLLNGQSLTLESLRHHPILVYFWATTCATCIEEIPLLVKLYHEFSPQGFHIIGIAMYYDPPNRIVYFTKNSQLPYDIAFDLERVAAQAFGEVRFVPAHFLIDQTGKIVYNGQGKLDETLLRRHLVQLLKN